MPKSLSDRILITPSPYAKNHYLYVQETGVLTSTKPHISSRQNLDSFLFLFVVSGRGTLTLQGLPHLLKQGDCAWIDCHLPYSHESSADAPWELKWVHFFGKDSSLFYSHFISQNLPAVFTPENPAFFNEILSSLLTLQKKNAPFRELLSHKYLTDLITGCFTENTGSFTGRSTMQDKLFQVREYLLAHFSRKISLEELSEHFYVSKYHLVREYKKTFGITPGNELIGCRISHAKSLLRFGNAGIEEIASLCGFHNSAYFIRMFKKTENMTPLEYRRKW